MSDIKDTKAYSINDFLNWNDRDELTLSPKYQRNVVWNANAKSYHIMHIKTIEDDEYIHKQYKARRLDTPGVHYINYLLA